MPYLRSCILGIFQQIIMKAFRKCRIIIMQNTRHVSCNSINHHHGRQLTTGQHIIPNGNIVRNDLLKNSLIHTFIVPTQKNNMGFFRQFLCHTLVKGLSLWRYVYHTRFPWYSRCCFCSFCIRRSFCLIICCDQRPVSIIDGLCLHQHACTATIRIIINLSVLFRGKIPDISHTKGNTSLLNGTTDNAGVQPLFNHFRKQC